MRLIFLHTGWCRYYQGLDNDMPIGQHAYLKSEDGHERWNFLDVDGIRYGHAPVNSKMNLKNVEKNWRRDSLDGVNVVWTATNPISRQRVIIGWYKNAKLFSEAQSFKNDDFDRGTYLACANATETYLLPHAERSFVVPSHKKGFPGQKAVWYPMTKDSNEVTNFIDEVCQYIGGKALPPSTSGRPSSFHGRQPDVEKRRAVENAAVDFTIKKFARKYELEPNDPAIKSVEKENVGWDYEINLPDRKLLLEIKGRSDSPVNFELTANEYDKVLEPRKHLQLCIVTNALEEKKRKLHVFKHRKNGEWASKSMSLCFDERLSATARGKAI